MYQPIISAGQGRGGGELVWAKKKQTKKHMETRQALAPLGPHGFRRLSLNGFISHLSCVCMVYRSIYKTPFFMIPRKAQFADPLKTFQNDFFVCLKLIFCQPF